MVFTLLRLFFWAAGLGCVAWGLLAPQFRDTEGNFRGAVCLPFGLAVALAILGFGVTSKWRAAAGWLALACVGQAAALQMVDAGQEIRYPHYQLVGTLFTNSPWLLLLLAFQSASVFIGFRSRFAVTVSWFARNFSVWQLIGLALVFVMTSATVSRDIGYYLQEIPFAAFLQTLNLLNMLLVVWSIPESTLTVWTSFTARLTSPGKSGIGSTKILVIVFAVLATLLSGLLSIVVYERHPHLGDEVTYLYQARYLATGVLSMPIPPVLEAFNLDLFDFDATRWYASPPPGWPLVLSVGVLLNADWLVNPLLSGICVVLAYVLVRELYDRRTALLTAFLLSFSPWLLLVGMSYMTHTSALAFALAAAVAVSLARKNASIFWALFSGGAVGMVALIRPLEGAIIGGLIGLWIVGLGGKRLRLSGLAAWAVGCGAVGGVNFYYNYILTGDPLKFPIMVWADKYMGVNSNAMGFGPERGNGWPIDPYPGHSPLDAMINANLNTTAINTELFGWATGSLFLIALLCFSARLRGSDLLMSAVIVGVFTAHFFYWFSGGPDFAARYWFLMIVPCVVLSVRGAECLIDRLSDAGSLPLVEPRVLIAVTLLSLMALVNFVPWRGVDKYLHYNHMRPDIVRLAKERGFGRSLILIRGEQFPDFASAAIYNPIDLQAGSPIYAWDQNPELRTEVLNAYRDRPVWIVNGPSITRAGFEIVEGPLPAAILLKRGPDGAGEAFLPVE